MKKFYFLVLFAFVNFISQAQQGILDVTFDGDGYAFIPRPGTNINTGYAIAVQPDGKIITAGLGQFGTYNWFQISRHNTNGSLDNTFGGSNNGIALINPAENSTDGSQSPAYSIAIQPDGKIIVVGAHEGYHDFLPSDFTTPIIRLNANGTLDNTFDGNGILSLMMASSSTSQMASDVALQPDGKIVISGGVFIGGISIMAIARVSSTGVPDNSFGGSGVVYVSNFSVSYGHGLKIQPDGKLVIAGNVTNGATGSDMVVVRLNTDGSFDNSFDGDGIATVDFNTPNDFAFDVDLQPDGKIVLSGSTQSTTRDIALVRLTSTGQLDATFNGTGKKVIDLGGSELANSVVVQSDGKILFGGTQGSIGSSNAKIVIVKLNSDGSPENNFDGDGIGLYNFSGMVSSEDIALQPDGKIVSVGAGGNATSPGGRVIARLTNTVAAAGALPVVLSDFTAKPKQQTALLEWRTTFEQNSDYFEILHSINGRDFKSVGKVKASGSSSDPVSYSFTHTTPTDGWNYYRLLMKDIDGKSTLSEVRKINFAADGFVELIPNPASSSIRIKHPLLNVNQIDIVDAFGRTVMQTTVASGAETVINTKALTAGVYTVVVIHKNGRSVVRFVKE